MKIGDHVYFDSSIWISYLLKDRHYDNAKSLFYAVENDKYTVIVSTLVLLEVIEVMRKRITQKERYKGLTESLKKQLKNKIDEKIREFIDKTTNLAKQGKILILDPDENVSSYFQKTLNVLSPYFGNIAHTSFCIFCQRTRSFQYLYKGVGHYDIEHAFNAKLCGATEVFAFDYSFEHFSQIPDFNGLSFTVLRS